MDDHSEIQLEFDINRTMIRKYMSKHYKIYNVIIWNRSQPASVKNPLNYTLFDIEKGKEIDNFPLLDMLTTIFSVTRGFANKVIQELAIEELDRLQRLKTNLFDERNHF